MAYYHSMLLLAVLLIATTCVAKGVVIINGTQIAQLRILGVVECAVPPPPPRSPPIAGVNVILSCNGGRSALSQALTDVNGFYQVVLNTFDGLLFDPSNCAIFIRLPVAGCALFPPSGNLRAPLTLLSTATGPLGGIAVFGTGPLKLVS